MVVCGCFERERGSVRVVCELCCLFRNQEKREGLCVWVRVCAYACVGRVDSNGMLRIAGRVNQYCWLVCLFVCLFTVVCCCFERERGCVCV